MLYLLTSGKWSKARFEEYLDPDQTQVLDVGAAAADADTLRSLLDRLAGDPGNHFVGLRDFGELVGLYLRHRTATDSADEVDGCLTVLDKQRMRDTVNAALPDTAIDCRPVTELGADDWPRAVKPRPSQLSIGSGLRRGFDEPRLVEMQDDATRYGGAAFTNLGRAIEPGPIADFCARASDLIAEELLPEGDQITVEVVGDQVCSSLSLFDERGLSFYGFAFPYTPPSPAAAADIDAVVALTRDLLGPNTPVFNLEFVVTAEHAWLVEANPRISSQYAIVNRHVFGVDTLAAVTGGTGGLPELTRWPAGLIRVLRTDTDQVFAPVVGQDELTEMLPDEVEVNYLGESGKKLSAMQQDGHSFRYAEITGPFDSSESSRAELARCEELVEDMTAIQ